MGKKNKKNQVKEEEIDLVKLFSLIGNVFSNFFKFIGKILKVLFHYFILLLIFIREHILKLSLAILIGVVVGLVLDSISPKIYAYDMIIEPNYRSIDQIYEKMEYYNVLIDGRDTISLAKEFNIDYSTANKLHKFQLIPYDTEKEKILEYDEFIRKTDTLTQKIFTYELFKSGNEAKFDSKKYVYRVSTLDKNLKSFQNKIIKDIESNKLLQNKRKINLNTLKLDSTATVRAIEDVNSLRELYKKRTLTSLETKGLTASTYIDFSKETDKNNDIELFEIVKGLNEHLIEVETEKEAQKNIVNIITNFNSVGKRIGRDFYETHMFFWGRLLGTLVLLLLLLRNLNEYINKYEKR